MEDNLLMHTSKRECSFYLWLVCVLVIAACTSERPTERGQIDRVQPLLSSVEPAVAALESKATSSEVLIAATGMNLPITEKSYYKGKFLDSTSGQITTRSYTESGMIFDAEAAENEELVARRALYGAWSKVDIDRLNQTPDSEQVTATFWIPFLPQPTNPEDKELAAVVTRAKASVVESARQLGLAIHYNDPRSPLMVVSGPALSIRSLGMHESVGQARLHKELETMIFAPPRDAPGDAQESIDVGMPTLVSQYGDMTDVKVVGWDACMPDQSVIVV